MTRIHNNNAVALRKIVFIVNNNKVYYAFFNNFHSPVKLLSKNLFVRRMLPVTGWICRYPFVSFIEYLRCLPLGSDCAYKVAKGWFPGGSFILSRGRVVSMERIVKYAPQTENSEWSKWVSCFQTVINFSSFYTSIQRVLITQFTRRVY